MAGIVVAAAVLIDLRISAVNVAIHDLVIYAGAIVAAGRIAGAAVASRVSRRVAGLQRSCGPNGRNLRSTALGRLGLRAREKAGEDPRHLAFLGGPVLGWNEIDVEIAGKEIMQLAAPDHAVGGLGDGVMWVRASKP